MYLKNLVGKKVIRMKPVVDKDVVTEKGILTTQDKVVEFLITPSVIAIPL